MADPLFMYSWYHGKISRTVSESILKGKRPGLFLVRDSSSLSGGFVLSVSENGKVSHYIITQGANGHYQIGDQTFPDLPGIVDFYKRHFLDSTTLVEAAPRESEPPSEPAPVQVAKQVSETFRVKAKYNFPGNDPEDLPFHKGDILTVLRKEEDLWWMARDSTGKEGMIPANYVEQLQSPRPLNPQPASRQNRISSPSGPTVYQAPGTQASQPDMTVPAIAEAVQDRRPSIYDPSELKFEKGDRILVLTKRDDGIWEGQLANGKRGMFPFTYVKLISNSPQDIAAFSSNG